MLVLFETPAGFALFKMAGELSPAVTENLASNFESAESANQL
jgi:hypothetical protein